MQVDALPTELRDYMLDQEACDPFEEVELRKAYKSSTIVVNDEILVLVPWEGFDYGDMVELREEINLQHVIGWDILGGPGASLSKKIDVNKPAWLVYNYTGDNTWYIYEF